MTVHAGKFGALELYDEGQAFDGTLTYFDNHAGNIQTVTTPVRVIAYKNELEVNCIAKESS